jgi:putative ABC transport system substrate-binding protein
MRLHLPIVSLGCVLALGGCARTHHPAPRSPAAAPDSPLVDAPRRPGKALILIAMPDTEALRSVRRAFINELRRDFDVSTRVVDQRTQEPDLEAAIKRGHPACVVLMSDLAVRLYEQYQQAHRDVRPTPAVVLMSPLFDATGGDLANASGVASEIPGVMEFVNLRSVINKPVNKVGVVHRPSFRSFVERQKALAADEQISVVTVQVPANPGASDIRDALRSLRAAGVDALWVPGDLELLKDAKFRTTAWAPEIAALGVPVMVSDPALVKVEARFGTLAVMPDLEPLGLQAANLIFDLAESDWATRDHPVALPVSTQTVVNMKQVREKFGLREGALERIDVSLE